MTARRRIPDLLDVQAERARHSLHYFLSRFAWPALAPATPFVDNWHIGAICFPAGTAVETKDGACAIETIRVGTMVLSCNHATGRLEWRPVRATMKNPGQTLVRIHTQIGVLRATEDHPIYVKGRGYLPAAKVRPGDGCFYLQALLDRVQEKPGAEPRGLLRHALLRTAQDAARRALHRLRWRHQQIQPEPTAALHVLPCKAAASVTADGMCAMWGQRAEKSVELDGKSSSIRRVLWPSLLRLVRDWAEESGLLQRRQPRHLRADVQEREAEGSGARWWRMFRLLGGGEAGRSSHRSRQKEQRHDQPRGRVQAMPPEAGERGCCEIVVDSIDREVRPDWVFNIEVAENYNYFAEGVLVHNCEHLEAVSRGEIRRLLINMPFRMLKSTIVSQAFPAWDWVTSPSRQFLTASYAGDVAMRDAVDARRIIDSLPYQRAFGNVFRLTTDQNVKTRYENDQRGRRIVTSTDAAGTGFGGDIRIVDDPVSAKKADSAVALAASIEWWRGTMATRANDATIGPAVIVHQRLNARDLTGYLLAEEKGWEHLVLPMRFDPALRKTTSLGWTDPRTVPGELLHPDRLTEETVRELEGSIGTYHKNAQLQQNPEPRGGIIFERKHWRYWKELPGGLAGMDEIVLSVDCTFKDLESSDFVAIQAWGRKGANEHLLKRTKARMNFSATVMAVRAMKALYPQAIAILIEDKANGSAVIETLSGEIPGVLAIQPEGGKVPRAYAMQPTQEAGNIYLPDPSVDPDIETFLTEASSFPASPNDDEVDAMTQYINWSRKRSKTTGLQDYYREQAAELARARQAA